MRRAAVVVVVAFLALAGFATPALAHNQLVASNPTDKATVETSPATVELTFDQPVQNGDGLNTIAITGPDATTWSVGAPEVAGNVVTTTVDGLGPAGDYTIGYRILSADGHPVRGELTFTLATAGDGTPAPASTESGGEASGPADPADDGGLPIWVWVLGAVVLLGAGLTVALRIGGKPSR